MMNEETYKNSKGSTVGYIREDASKNLVAYCPRRKKLATYNVHRNVTLNKNNKTVGQGNFLTNFFDIEIDI